MELSHCFRQDSLTTNPYLKNLHKHVCSSVENIGRCKAIETIAPSGLGGRMEMYWNWNPNWICQENAISGFSPRAWHYKKWPMMMPMLKGWIAKNHLFSTWNHPIAVCLAHGHLDLYHETCREIMKKLFSKWPSVGGPCAGKSGPTLVHNQLWRLCDQKLVALTAATHARWTWSTDVRPPQPNLPANSTSIKISVPCYQNI